MEAENARPTTPEQKIIPESIKPGIEKELELQRQQDELDKKYLSDMERLASKKVVPTKERGSPWLLASLATFIISGLVAVGPLMLSYIVFGLSGLALVRRLFFHETPEKRAERLARKEQKKLKEKTLLDEAIRAAGEGEALTLPQLRRKYGYIWNWFAKITSFNDEHNVIVTEDNQGNPLLIHLTENNYKFCKQHATNRSLDDIVTLWKREG